VSEQDWLAERFEENRAHLQAVAYRMLGGAGEADDAVQEAWLRLSRSDTSEVQNLSGWLTTVVARVCLDMLRSRTSRREQPLEVESPEDASASGTVAGPEEEALLTDSIGVALLVVLETLTPAERVAFVLHDVFDLPFEEIALVVGRSTTAARQLASRARRRVRQTAATSDTNAAGQRTVVDAFLTASRDGDFNALLELLDPDVVLRSDAAAAQMGAPAELVGAMAVAERFSGQARAARLALIDGSAGLVWSQGGQPRVVFALAVAGGRITSVEMIADPQRLSSLQIQVLEP
jgi:RNA polymerase sigma factor (sigma-70 family)